MTGLLQDSVLRQFFSSELFRKKEDKPLVGSKMIFMIELSWMHLFEQSI